MLTPSPQSPQQISALRRPLKTPYQSPQIAEVTQTLRGGQITFHGPGQLVIYPIFDLKSIHSPIWPKGLSVRCYVHLLEQITINTIARWGVKGVRTENPGVWVPRLQPIARESEEDNDGKNEKWNDKNRGERKIAALGVHLRRNISSYGVGLNLRTDLRWFNRITACGLEGKTTTSLRRETRGALRVLGEGMEGIVEGEMGPPKVEGRSWKVGSLDMSPAPVAKIWVREFARELFGASLLPGGDGEGRGRLRKGEEGVWEVADEQGDGRGESHPYVNARWKLEEVKRKYIEGLLEGLQGSQYLECLKEKEKLHEKERLKDEKRLREELLKNTPTLAEFLKKR
jgi:lipoate-protein ligase B